jgi:hypothetical protein
MDKVKAETLIELALEGVKGKFQLVKSTSLRYKIAASYYIIRLKST